MKELQGGAANDQGIQVENIPSGGGKRPNKPIRRGGSWTNCKQPLETTGSEVS